MARYTVERIPPEPSPYRPPGYRAPDHFVVRGSVPSGPFVFEHPIWGTADDPQDQGFYEFDEATAVDAEFTFDNVGWYSADSSFSRCIFRQTRRRNIDPHTSGMFGRRWSTFQDCTFDHIDFGHGGGFLLWNAAFKRCTFQYCNFRSFQANYSDFIDCTFVGVMQSAWFWGATIPGDEMQRQNQFSGNDLSGAKLRRVYFRNGVDLSANRLPNGPEYIHLDRFPDRLEHARAIVETWPDEERRHAEFILDIYRKDNMDILFAWRRILAGPQSLWDLLESTELVG
jgi:hypothetical protein